MDSPSIDELLRDHATRWSSDHTEPSLDLAAGQLQTGFRRWNRRTVFSIAASIAAVGIIALIPVVHIVSHPHGSQATSRSQVDHERLREFALETARTNGDSSVTAEAVSSTDRPAELLITGDSGPEPDRPVWVVQIHGDFVCSECSRPTAGTAIAGKTIVVILDRQTFTTISITIDSQSYDLSRLGHVVNLSS